MGYRLRLCAGALCVAIWAVPVLASTPPDAFSARILEAHNRERLLAGVPPLQWDTDLSVSAASYGPALASIGRLQHSPKEGRPGQRENLWMGTRGAFSPEQMVGTWAAEKRYYRPGIFPAVSSTGNWIDVAHFTTMVWPSTTRVGCALFSSGGWDYLICRYSPPGNIDGLRLQVGSR